MTLFASWQERCVNGFRESVRAITPRAGRNDQLMHALMGMSQDALSLAVKSEDACASGEMASQVEDLEEIARLWRWVPVIMHLFGEVPERIYSPMALDEKMGSLADRLSVEVLLATQLASLAGEQIASSSVKELSSHPVERAKRIHAILSAIYNGPEVWCIDVPFDNGPNVRRYGDDVVGA